MIFDAIFINLFLKSTYNNIIWIQIAIEFSVVLSVILIYLHFVRCSWQPWFIYLTSIVICRNYQVLFFFQTENNIQTNHNRYVSAIVQYIYATIYLFNSYIITSTISERYCNLCKFMSTYYTHRHTVPVRVPVLALVWAVDAPTN